MVVVLVDVDFVGLSVDVGGYGLVCVVFCDDG